MRSRITPNTDTFHAVSFIHKKYGSECFGPEITKNVIVDDNITPKERQENKRETKERDPRVKWATTKF